MFELKFLSDVFKKLKSSLDDTVDRLNYLFTCALLIVFSLIIGSKQTFGSPLHCLTPTEYPSKWDDYLNNYCFVSNTYISKNDSELMPHVDMADKDKINVSYYQWVPFIFALQGLLFHMPHYFWMILQKWSDVDFQYIVEKCGDIRDNKDADHDKNIDFIVRHIKLIVKSRTRKGRLNGMGCSATIAYLFSKFMNIGNLLIQLYFIKFFIGDQRLDWGYQLLQNLMNGVYWHQSGLFPLVTFCDFKRDGPGITQDRTIQCVLMVNVINEKLFLILYFWFLILLVLTIANFIYAVFLVSGAGQNRLIKHLFKDSGDDIHVRTFIVTFLGTDGLLLFRFIQNDVGAIVGYEIANRLYELQEETLGVRVKNREVIKSAVISQSKERLLAYA